MAANNDKRKSLYDQLTGDGYDLGDFQSFSTNLNDSTKRRNLYDAITKDNYDVGDYDSFSRKLDEEESANQPGIVAQQVVDEWEQAAKQSSMNTGAVFNDNPAGPQRQPAQSPEEDKRTLFANYVQEQLGNIDKELNKPREALPMPAGSAFIPSTAVAAAQRYGNAQTREQQDRYTSLKAARNFLDEANKVVTEAGKKGKTNFVAGALRGIRDKGFDPDTWMMGISETSYYNLLRQAAEKEERGETLSAEEQQLLDAAAVNMAANAYYASDLGRGYKAGAVTAESIPFMLQFAVNPLSGAGTGIAKTILKHGIKRFGLNTAKRTLAGRAVRGAARVAGDAVAAAGVTATTGLGNVAEDAERRMAGDVQFAQDEQGNIHYAGRVNNVEDTGEAIARAFASTFFENQSEMVGNYFAPIMRGVSGLVKRIPGVKQLSASKVGDLYRGIKDNPTYKEFTDRTQWHGAIGEYAEEVYNNLASVAMGDMTPEELVDLDNNIDTFLGVGLMSAVFGGIGAAGFARDRYTLNRDIRRFEADLTPEEMERWQAVKQVATSGDVEGVREFVKYTMRDDSLTPQEKKDEIAYIYNVMKQSAMEGVAAEQTEEAVEAETQDILAHSDQAANTYTECNRIVVNDVGEMVEQPGHIVGYMGGQPLWIPDGAEPGTAAIPLKEGEYNPESIRSMPTQEVIDETAQAIREDAAEQARRESMYSPDIVPPSIGTTFADGASQYQIVQQNPEGGWLATRTTVDDKGKPVQEVVPVTDQEYYDLMQAQIDSQEQQTAVEQVTDGGSTSLNRHFNETVPQSASDKSSTPSDEVEQLTAPSRTLDNTSIPTDEKGNLLYHRAPVERTVSSINAEGLEPDEVDAFISANKDAAAKQLKSIEGKAPKMGTNIAKYKADKDTWQEKVADAQAQVDYWNQVGETIVAQRTQVGDTTAEDIRAMGEPMNGHELAAMMLATGRLPLLQSDFKRETGYKGGEARDLFGLFASEANGGMTIERAGELLMLADQEDGTNFFDQDDPNAGRNAILDVLAEVRTRGDLTNYIRRNREAMAERERQAEYDAYADWCDEVMHMTPEEYEAYQEYIAENNPYEGVAVEELDRIFAEAEEEIQNNLINTSEYGQEGTSENGSETDSGPSERDEPAGEAGSREASVPVLPGAQPVLQGQEPGRAGGTETASGPADDGVRAAERTVAEGASGGERGVIDIRPIGEGDFGPIYDQFVGKPKEAIDFLLSQRDGEAIGALHHRDIGDIDLVWGKEGTSKSDGYGLSKLAKYHPEVLGNLQEILDDMQVVKRTDNRVQLESEKYKAAIRLTWDGQRKNWLLTAFQKETPTAADRTTDIGDTELQNDTAPLQTVSDSSEDKGRDSSANSQTNSGFIAPERQTDENLLDYAERVTKVKEIADARKDVSANPTDAQKEAGNYKKGHITLDGYDITIENPKGSTRSGVDANGQPWSVTMNNDYGYIRGTQGVDGDHIDVFLSDDPTTGKVYVIDQVKEDGSFDEHKVMYGFKSALAAKRAYLANYSPGWKGLGTISEVSKEEFKKWVDSSHRKTKPFAEYKSVKVEGAQSEESNALQNQTQKRYRLLQSFVLTKDGKLKKKYANTFKKPVYAVFDSNNPNSEPFYIASSPRDALNAAFNYDMENFDVLYVNAPENKVELGAYSLLAYGQDASYDSDGAFREEIKQRLAEDIGKLGPARLEESNIETDNDHLPDAGEMNRVQEEAEKIQQQSGPVEKIEDVGEKIGGAKKDRFKEFAEKEKQLQEKPDSFMEELRKLPVSKIFNFNLEALRKDGLSNEAATLIDVIRRVIPSKPRTDWKLKRWVSDVFGLYRFCLTLATAEQGTFDQVLERVTNIKQIGGMYRAQMSLGGFDSGLDTGQATLEELGDSAGHYDKDDNWVSLKGQWYVAHAGRYGGIYPDYEKAKEALAQFAGENSKGKEKGTEVKFSVYSYKNSGEAFITPKGKPNIVVESGFKSSKEAMDYLNEHMDELQAKYRNMKDSTSIGFAPNSERRGKDWRGDKDVTAEDFRNTFGFRGVEFGNWANQQERQRALNQAYDAFMDLSEATGISPRGLSLGGELGMAFGARGGGGAAAHYEPGKVVINLTKTQGAGTLAHEWWHAIDNYFSRRRGQALGYNTERKGYNLPVRGGKVEREHEAERKEITNAFTALMKAINGSSYGERSNAYANLKSSYWKEPTELGARAFAVWVERKLSEKSIVNNFLANNNTIGWESPELTQKYYPYPLESDFESLDTAFDGLFGAIEEKVDEETGNTVLYRFIGEQGASRLDASEEATTRMDNLAIARKMEKEGKNAWAIKWATGWERGADRKWRYETPDFEYTPPENFEEGKNYNLSDIIKDNELFTAYPKLRGLKFRLENLPDEYGGGWFGGNEIVINTAYNNPSRYESTIAHEIQHAIQAYEGFETGDNPDDVIDRYLNAQYEIDTADIYTLDVAAFIRKRAERLIKKGKYKYMRWAIRAAMGPLRGRNDMYSEYGPIETLTVYHTAKELKDAYEKAYKAGKSFFAGIPTKNDAKAAYMRNAGETEARNVERRLQLTPEKRRETMAWETEDVSRRDQLFINSALSEPTSYAPAAEDIRLVNERFNKELQRYQDGQMSKNDMFHLGNPYGTMRMFLPDLPIVMRQRIVNKGSNRKHDVDVTSLQDMPVRISEPIFVFKKNDGSVGILTEMKDRNGRNVFVAFDIATTIQDGGEYLEVNNATTVHGRRVANIVRPILENDSLQWVDKEKALNWFSSASPDVQQEITNQELSDATKIVENFENPIIEEEILREGAGNLSDADLSNANDPVSKLLGQSTRTANQRRAFAERERRNMTARVQELAGKLHLDNVEIVDEPMAITDRKGKTHYPKGFYNRATDKIVIVIPNNISTFDAEQTLLHEAVAHYGLRRLFGEHFDTFLDNVFNNADVEVRRKIVALAQKNGWDTRLATEEYLASLAEDTNFDDLNASWWRKIKDLFLRMLHKIGFEGFDGVTLSDNELRYILWRSYENLREPGRYRSILGQAEDIAKQYELKVGNYAPTASSIGQVAEAANSAKAERIRKLRESKPVEITGKEIEPSDDLKQYKKNALEYGKKLQGSYTNKDTGRTIQLQRGRKNGGLKEVLQHDISNNAHIQSVAAIPQIIENAIYIDSAENNDVSRNPNVAQYHYYVCGLKIGGEDYTVRMVEAEEKDGSRYYDHKLSHIEKGKLLNELAQINLSSSTGLSSTPGTGAGERNRPTNRGEIQTAPISEVKDTKLLSILQDNSEENLLFREADNEKDAESMNTESPSPISTPTVEAWDKLANSFKFQLRETAVDHLTAVEKFQDLVAKHSGKEIQAFENAYNLMLALSSKTKNEMDMFDSFLVRPLNKAILELVGGKSGIRKWNWDNGPLHELLMYVEAKHGAERNRQMAVEKLAKGDASEESILKDWSEAKKRINARKNLSWMEKQRLLDEEATKLGADLSKDYSGLSSVFKDAEKYPKGWKESSWEYVEQYEKVHDAKDIDALWNAISNATGYALQKQYESGLVSKEYVERQKDRFENYVPLRGFADEIAGDVYNYMGNDFYPGGNPVKKAGGRTSEAGNPFGSILNTAYASMSTGNKNMAKLALYSLVVNHDTGGLAITNRAWMVKYDELKGNKELGELLVIPKIPAGEETPEWVEAVPKMPEKATSEEITEVLKRFEEAMNKYQKADVTKPVGKKAKTAYRTLYHERDQHDIPLYIAGDKYVITVTGNPRLAQAMNGLLNPDVNNDVASAFGKRVQRFMAGAFTAKNAAFALGNLSKDSMYANNQAFIRENPKYWWRFTKNQRLGFGDFQPMMRRLHKYREGKLDMNDKTERLFKEFMDNGGATGYTFVNSQDEYARELAKKLKDLSRKTPEWFTPKGTLKLFFDLVEFAGQSAELVNRFAAYKTSREMGRSINRSIIDAKEITVNFNRKGAGLKTSKVNRSTKGDESLLGGFKPIDIFAFISQYGSSSIIFWNANMQAKYRLYKNLKEHPVRTSTTLIANSMVIGAVAIPLLNNLLLPALYDVLGWSSGDDDEDYYDVLTDWERTHNICIRLPEGYWLKIPLSPEMSPWYSMGDAIFGAASGKRDLSATDFIKSAIDAVSPFSINWSYGDRAFLLNFLPSVGKPIAEVMLNTNFMGNPLYKTPFSAKQGFTPEYKLVYNSASPTLIELSRLSNRVAGGSDLKTSGKWKDWNPATLQNLISGYTGGYGTTMLSVADWIVGTSHGEKQAVTFSRMPLVSRFVISGNKDVKLKRINSSFYKVRDFVNEFEYDRKSLEDAIRESRKSGDMLKMADYISQLEDLFDSDRAKKYVQLKDLVDASKRYEDYLKEFPEDETTRNLLYGIKMEGIERLRE